MKKLISFSIVSLAILIPKIALAQPTSQNLTPTEKELIRSFVCSNEDYTRGDVISTINSSNLTVSNARRNDIADAIMNGQQMPKENRALICES